MRKLGILVALALVVGLAVTSSGEAASPSQVKKLTASDAQAGDYFGISTAVSGDTAVVGAHSESNAGAAYVFQRNAGGADNWAEVKKLTASDAQAGDYFGARVAVSGDIAVVSAVYEDSGGSNAGAAYVFQRNWGGTDNWGEVKKLTASDAQAGDYFGMGVAVSGDIVVVSAVYEDSGGSSAGAAYVFQRNAGGADNWGEVKKLTASDAQASDYFGVSAAVNGDTAVVGAYAEDAGGIDAGAAYVFQRNAGGADNWGEVKKLTASDAQAYDEFGRSVAVSGDTAVVGAHYEHSGGSIAGAAYVFSRNQGGTDNWGQVKKLTASDAQAGDEFGYSAAVSGDTAVVGAYWEDAGGSDAGAAYVFATSESSLAQDAANLAKAVVGAPYLGDGFNYGGKGWDCVQSRFVEADGITDGYYYYDGRIKKCSSLNGGKGQGLDCAGLSFWAYNKAGGAPNLRDGPLPLYYGAVYSGSEGARRQYSYYFTLEVAEEDLLPGDLLFFQGNPWHVVMYVGPGDPCGDVVHAYNPDAGIICEPKEEVISRLVGNGMVFKGFRRLPEVPVGIVFEGASPIDLTVTDPDGLTVTKDTAEIPGHLFYLEWDVDGDGDFHDFVTGPERKIGAYLITVIPEPDAAPTNTYTLTVEADGQTIILAEDVPISDIPGQGYRVRSTEEGVFEDSSVGGIAEYPSIEARPVGQSDSRPAAAALAGAVAGGALLLSAGCWCVRRRWPGRR